MLFGFSPSSPYECLNVMPAWAVTSVKTWGSSAAESEAEARGEPDQKQHPPNHSHRTYLAGMSGGEPAVKSSAPGIPSHNAPMSTHSTNSRVSRFVSGGSLSGRDRFGRLLTRDFRVPWLGCVLADHMPQQGTRPGAATMDILAAADRRIGRIGDGQQAGIRLVVRPSRQGLHATVQSRRVALRTMTTHTLRFHNGHDVPSEVDRAPPFGRQGQLHRPDASGPR